MCLVDHNRAIYRPFVNELPDNRSHHVVYDRTMIDIRADCYLWSSILIYNWSPIDIFPYNRALVNIRVNCHLWPPIDIFPYNRALVNIRMNCHLWPPIDIFPYNRALVNIRMNCHLWPPIHIWAYNVQGIWPGFLRIMEML